VCARARARVCVCVCMRACVCVYSLVAPTQLPHLLNVGQLRERQLRQGRCPPPPQRIFDVGGKTSTTALVVRCAPFFSRQTGRLCALQQWLSLHFAPGFSATCHHCHGQQLSLQMWLPLHSEWHHHQFQPHQPIDQHRVTCHGTTAPTHRPAPGRMPSPTHRPAPGHMPWKTGFI
jgi:hypothetical protein